MNFVENGNQRAEIYLFLIRDVVIEHKESKRS